MIVIRDAAMTDAARIREIYDYYVQHTAISFEYATPTQAEMEARMRRTMARYPYLVAERDGVVQGYAYAGPFVGRAAYDWGSELSIYLAADAQRCGMGKLLYTAMEQALGRMGILDLYACIGVPEREDAYLTNNSADFHAHLGFRRVALFRNCGRKFGRWYHMIWMEKTIGEHRADQPSVTPYPQTRGGTVQTVRETKLDHAAVYVRDLEAARAFFVRYLGGVSGERYENVKTGFRSYFLRFGDGARLELMYRPELADAGSAAQCGYAHTAFSLGNREAVDALTQRLRGDGYAVVSGPRVTGDGYYESCVVGPEGLLVELTV